MAPHSSPVNQGNLVEYIRGNFESGAFSLGGPIEASDRMMFEALRELGLPGMSPQIGLDEHLFTYTMSNIPRAHGKQISGVSREVLDAARARAYRLDSVIEGAGQVGADAAIGQEIGYLGRLRLIKPPTADQSGYASFAFTYSDFADNKMPEQTAAMLSYNLSNLQVSTAGDLRLAGTTYTADYLMSQANIFHNIKQPGGSNIPIGRKVLFLDTETTGVHAASRPWQIYGDLTRADAQGQLVSESVANINLRGMMDGMWPDGVSFEEFMTRRPGGEALQFSDDALGSLREFFRVANQADEIVAHNIGFDIDQILRLINDNYASFDSDLVAQAARFGEKLKSGILTDTRALAAMVLGDILPAGASADDYKRFSMENILARTNITEYMDRSVVQDLIDGKVLHSAEHDVRILREVYSTLREAVAGRIEIDTNVTNLNPRLIEAIGKGSAVTPLTGLAELDGETPLRHGILQQRELGPGSATVKDLTIDRLFDIAGAHRTGEGARWFDYMTGGTDDLARGRLLFDSSYSAVQAQAIEAGMPFGGLSAPEKLLSMAMSRATRQFPGKTQGPTGAITNLMNVMMDEVGGSIFEASTKTGRRGSAFTISSEALMDDNIKRLLGLGMDSSSLDMARVSFYQYAVDGGVAYDAALVIDPFSAFEPGELSARAGQLADALEDFGLSSADADFLRRNPEILQQRGIQIGNLGSSESAKLAYNIADRLDVRIDATGRNRVNVALMGMFEDGRFIGVSPAMIGERGRDWGGLTSDQVRNQVHRMAELINLVDEQGSDPTLARMLGYASRTGNIERAKKMYKAASWIRSNGRLPKILASVAGAGILGKLGHGRYQMRQYDETMNFQGYEDPSFYEDYREQMGLPFYDLDYRQSHIDALATARLMGELDRNKIGHTTMGAGKYDHLFV